MFRRASPSCVPVMLLVGGGLLVLVLMSALSTTDAHEPAQPTIPQQTDMAVPAGTIAATETPHAAITPFPTEVGQIIPLVSSSGADLTLVRTEAPELISREDAIQAVADLGVPFAHGGEWRGNELSISATYGVGTFGAWDAAANTWEGPRNLLLPDGQILDHVEDRPMWILEYRNATFDGDPPLSHTAYAVDAHTGGVLLIWGYDGE